MKKYHLNKKEILFWANKARKYLNLPKIKIDIFKVLFAGQNNEVPYPHFQEEINHNSKVQIGVLQVKTGLIVDRGHCDLEKIKLEDSKEWIIFSLFHEFAHYFQWYYYRKWFNKFAGYEYYVNFNGKHKDKHIERNADKIALILFNKLYKENK